jgi:hypothetical protein
MQFTFNDTFLIQFRLCVYLMRSAITKSSSWSTILTMCLPHETMHQSYSYPSLYDLYHKWHSI